MSEKMLTPEDIAAGWLPWSGGENPAPGKTVEIRMRGWASQTGPSDSMDWSRDVPRDGDIVAYLPREPGTYYYHATPSPAAQDDPAKGLEAAIDAEMDGRQRGYSDVRGELLFRCRDALATATRQIAERDARLAELEDILRTVCGHLGLPQSESGPADDVTLYDFALENLLADLAQTESEKVKHRTARYAAEARASTLEAENKGLREALEPFANLGVTSGPDDEPCAIPYRITRGSIRTARQALAKDTPQ